MACTVPLHVMKLKIKRIYEQPEVSDGIRILVDKIWPRGVKKEDARLDGWWKEIAPSDELRKWFDHDPEKWEDFKTRYKQELKANSVAIEDALEKVDGRKSLMLLYGAKDEKHNQAIVLKEYLEELWPLRH